MHTIPSFYQTVLNVYGKLQSFVVHPKLPKDDNEFEPVIRFVVSSDSHITTIGDIQTTRVEKMFKIGNDVAKSHPTYKQLDAVFIAGDVTDRGRKIAYGSIKAAVSAVKKKDTQFWATISHSHDDHNLGKGSLECYSTVMDQETDFHTVINGFHFIGISASKTDGEHYGEYQKKWLKEELDRAVADDSEKPIFVIQHEHISNTVYGSSDFEGWGMPDFADILNQYSQVIDFSGHSHYPINDARSIWQGKYTALGTGGLYFAEFTVDDERTVHPKGWRLVSTFWIVEIDKNYKIRLRAVDICSKKYLCEYVLDGPLDRKFTPLEQKSRSKPPVFVTDSFAKIKGKNIVFDAAQSTDGMPIFIYRVYAVDSQGDRRQIAKTLARYFRAEPQKRIKIKIDKLLLGNSELEIVAENCYGLRSEPLKFR